MKLDKSLLSNFSYLTILQVLGVLAPLLTYPYLLRVIGDNLFGKVIWAYSFAQFFVTIVNFGFNITGTKDITENVANSNKINEIASSIYIIKISLFVLGFILLITSSLIFDVVYENILLLVISYLFVLSEVFIPIWYFQGVERMRSITILSGGGKILSTILIFIFVNSPVDFLRVPFFQFLAAIVSSIFSVFLLYKYEKVRFVLVEYRVLKSTFLDGLQFFAARVSSIVIQRTNIFVIQAYFGFSEVAIYDTVVKIVNLVKIPYDLTNQVVYPYIVRTKNMKVIRIIIQVIIITGIFEIIGIYLFGDWIFSIVYGEYSQLGFDLLRILIISAPITGVGYFLGNTTLVVHDYKLPFNKSIIFAMIFFVVIISVLMLVNQVSPINVAILSVFITAFWVLYRYFYVNKYKLLRK